MNISGIRPYQGFYQYNSKRVLQLQQEQLAMSRGVLPEEPKPEVREEKAEQSLGAVSAQPAREQNFSSADYAKQYDPKAVIDKKDRDVSLNTLDVEKAVSDLDKDQVLRRYQYFVDAGKEQKASALRDMENFSL